MTKIKNFHNKINKESIVLVCVVRDEELIIDSFINHYKDLGITHFIFIDNTSQDRTLELLLIRTDINSEIYSEHESYAENLYGVGWVNTLLNDYLKDVWCLVVDADEFLILSEFQNLTLLRNSMIQEKANVVETCLVDFYPKTFNSKTYCSGSLPFEHSNYFHKFTPESIFLGCSCDNSRIIKGGLRHTILNTNSKPTQSSVCLTKKSFFHNTFSNTHYLDVGMHWIMPKDFTDWSTYRNWKTANLEIRFFKEIQIICHFKYLRPNIKEWFQLRINRNQDWDNGTEYKKYIEYLNDSYYDEEYSIKYNGSCSLYTNTLNILYDDY